MDCISEIHFCFILYQFLNQPVLLTMETNVAQPIDMLKGIQIKFYHIVQGEPDIMRKGRIVHKWLMKPNTC